MRSPAHLVEHVIPRVPVRRQFGLREGTVKRFDKTIE